MTTLEEAPAGQPSPEELSAALADTEMQVSAYFGGLPGDTFFAGSAERWSPAHHLSHLILAHRPLSGALRLPKRALLAANGRAARESRGYTELRVTYLAALAAGGRASGRYLPALNGESQAQLVSGFHQASQELRRAVSAWSEADLNRYLLPHPLMGQLTVRETLYFAIFHQLHHLNGVRDRLGQARGGADE